MRLVKDQILFLPFLRDPDLSSQDDFPKKRFGFRHEGIPICIFKFRVLVCFMGSTLPEQVFSNQKTKGTGYRSRHGNHFEYRF